MKVMKMFGKGLSFLAALLLVSALAFSAYAQGAKGATPKGPARRTATGY